MKSSPASRSEAHEFLSRRDEQPALRVVYFTGHGIQRPDDLLPATTDRRGVSFGLQVNDVVFGEPDPALTTLPP